MTDLERTLGHRERSRKTEEQESFTHDVFLSHSSRDKSIVRELAERLRSDGMRVWFEESEIEVTKQVTGVKNDQRKNLAMLRCCTI